MSRRPRHPRRPRPAPQAIDERSRIGGLRAIAIFEAVKGSLVLLLEFGLLSLIHKDLGEVAEHAVHMLHMNPERHLSQAIIHAASEMTNARLWAIAAGGLAYAAVRFVEAYGLWNRRVWAEWFALLSGGLYLPWEIFEVAERTTPLRVIILTSNVIIVLYMLFVRIRASRPEAESAAI
jgi:uncharacterized membrane protein (DUF2068 family)